MLIPKLALSIIFLTSVSCGRLLAIKKVYHYEKSLPTTITEPTTGTDNSEQLFLKEPAAPRCPYDTQQQPGEPSHSDVDTKDEPTESVEEHLNDIDSMKWPVESNDADAFSSMKHFAEEEPNQVDSRDGMENKRDMGYELVNHRFEPDNFAFKDRASQSQDQPNDRDPIGELNKDWWTWPNTISYFPSGRAHLRKHWKTSSMMNDQPQKRPDFGNWLANKDLLYTNNNPFAGARSKEIVMKQNSLPVSSSRGQKIEKTIVELPDSQVNTLQVVNNVKSENINEIDQQDQLHLREPIMMMPIDEQLISVNQQQTEPNQKQATNLTASPDAASILVPSLNEQRVRDSLLKAADLARQLAASAGNQSDGAVRPEVRTLSSSMTVNEQPSLISSVRGRDFDSELSARFSSSVDSSDSERQLWQSLDQTNGFNFPVAAKNRTQQPATRSQNWQIENNSMAESTRLDAKFLGFGKLQKNDPIYGNGRTQARLSCQFGDDSSYSNMSISNVEWGKFTGNYNPYEDGPSFECVPGRSCELRPVKTDPLTTVHPRPAVQNYINTTAPSYSVTLHEIGDKHLGVYRCSATRQVGDRKELVYRIITLD